MQALCEQSRFALQDTKAAQEVAALQAFHAMLGQDSARAFYGPGHVRAAHELGAIQTLLISDTLFRVNNVAKVSPDFELCILVEQCCSVLAVKKA